MLIGGALANALAFTGSSKPPVPTTRAHKFCDTQPTTSLAQKKNPTYNSSNDTR